MAQSAPLSSNTVMAVVPDSNRIPFYIYSANNFSNRIFYIGLFDFPRRRRPQKVQSLSAPGRSRIFIIASANANCKGECFLPYEISKPFRTQKSLYCRAKTPIGGFENRAFPSRPAVNGPAAPSARRFCPPAQSEKQAAAVLRWVLRKGCAKTEAPAGAALQQKAAFLRLLSAAVSPCSLANAHRNYEKAPPRLVFSNGSTQ